VVQALARAAACAQPALALALARGPANLACEQGARRRIREDDMSEPTGAELEQLHREAEGKIKPFAYQKPDAVNAGKGFVGLARTDILKATVQVVKKNGGENNLHYHKRMDTFWMVLKGRVRFYGPGDVVIGEFGPNEGTFTPRYSRYWFENVGDGDLELLQVAAYTQGASEGGRTDVSEQRYKVGSGERFGAQV
jgi:mannose-6-phosphate isomerase-like protein (cupin superfamily)